MRLVRDYEGLCLLGARGLEQVPNTLYGLPPGGATAPRQKHQVTESLTRFRLHIPIVARRFLHRTVPLLNQGSFLGFPSHPRWRP